MTVGLPLWHSEELLASADSAVAVPSLAGSPMPTNPIDLVPSLGCGSPTPKLLLNPRLKPLLPVASVDPYELLGPAAPVEPYGLAGVAAPVDPTDPIEVYCDPVGSLH